MAALIGAIQGPGRGGRVEAARARTKLQGRDAGHDAGGTGDATPAEALFEPQRADQRSEQHRSLAQRRDRGDRRTRHRPEHDAIRGEAACATA
jgi:hypothetical protein